MKENIAKTTSEQPKAERVVVSLADRYAAYAGLDVHKDTIAVAIALPGRDEPLTGKRSPTNRGKSAIGWID